MTCKMPEISLRLRLYNNLLYHSLRQKKPTVSPHALLECKKTIKKAVGCMKKFLLNLVLSLLVKLSSRKAF